SRDWSSDVCSSDLSGYGAPPRKPPSGYRLRPFDGFCAGHVEPQAGGPPCGHRQPGGSVLSKIRPAIWRTKPDSRPVVWASCIGLPPVLDRLAESEAVMRTSKSHAIGYDG